MRITNERRKEILGQLLNGESVFISLETARDLILDLQEIQTELDEAKKTITITAEALTEAIDLAAKVADLLGQK